MSKVCENFPYADLLDLPHHVSANHRPMTREQRAAQFAPFAALTGFGEAIDEARRLTNSKIELTEDAKDELDRRLAIASGCSFSPELYIRYFEKDELKEGGAYVSVSGKLSHIDRRRRRLVLEGGIEIAIDDISAIEGDIFPETGL